MKILRVKLYWRLLVLIAIAFWSVLTAMILLSTRNKYRTSESNEDRRRNDLDISGLLAIKESNLNSSRSISEKSGHLYQLLKAAWPSVAKPGDAGYGGAGVFINRSLLTEREKIIYDNGLKDFGANLLASDRVALRRNIVLDMPECRSIVYPTATLPTVGIVIIFTDEMWSSLMRTVFSILDAGPEELISEIILVDDASEKDHLGKPLDDYLYFFGGKVKLVRLPERKGLIMARLTGFQHVTGEVAVFLDGHCEVSKGWLEPLLHRIKEDDSVIAVPQHDNLIYNTFEYKFSNNTEHMMCGFEFDMKFTWIPMPPIDGIKRKSPADPVPTPIHMGCCFATSKRNFERIGCYDPGLQIWGCENLELSFKVWMCGGRLEIIPCSHVAHMFRPNLPFKWVGGPHIFEKNCLRVAEVWMDEYKVFYQDRTSNLQTAENIGDVSERKALREKLKCRSFDWYIKEIHPDIYIPINTTAIGRISNVAHPNMCIDENLKHSINQRPKAGICNPQSDQQYFYLTREKQIRQDSHCLSYNKQENELVSKTCKVDHGSWIYSEDNLIRLEGTDHCIGISSNQSAIIIVTCNSSDTSQQWNWPRKSLTLS